MSWKAVIDYVEIVVADAAGVAMLGWWFRKFRRARQLRIGLVEAGRLIEVELKRDPKTMVITLKTPESVGRGEVWDAAGYTRKRVSHEMYRSIETIF